MCDELAAEVDKAGGLASTALQAKVKEAATEFNALRKKAEEARVSIIVHRQAVGFRSGNYSIVMEKWPLPAKRSLTGKAGGEKGDGDTQGEKWRKGMERLLHKRR